jgi:predicted oxidoreductase
VLTQKIIEKEFALSGSEQNPDLTGKDVRRLLERVTGDGAPAPIEAFKRHGADFVVAATLQDLVRGMNEIGGPEHGGALIDEELLRRQIEARDRQIDNGYTKDVQIAFIRQHRAYRGDRLIRTARPHKLLDPKNGPLIAVRLNLLTRKTLGGLVTDLSGRCLTSSGEPLSGLYAAGEVAGFGGGGMMGYNALEGTFLGGCLFSGRTAGRAAAAATA